MCLKEEASLKNTLRKDNNHMDAYIASIPNHLLYALQMIKQNNIEECDLYYVPTSNNSDELVSRIKETGIFHDVILLPNINIEYPITIKQCIKIAWNRFGARKKIRGKHYNTVYYNTDGWLLNSIVFSSFSKKPVKNVFVENGLNPYITSYDDKEWYLRLFINCQFMTCMDGKYIDERYLFEPSLVSVKQSGDINRIQKIDRKDQILRRRVNEVFDYDETKDSFDNKEIIIMEQGPRKEPIDMLQLWGTVSEYIAKNKAIVKAHPRQKESALRELGYDIYDRFVIPWEVLAFNHDMNEKTLISFFSTSCVNPKIMFDEEPRVILLYKLIGIDYSFLGKGLVDYETWEEFGEYCRVHNLDK